VTGASFVEAVAAFRAGRDSPRAFLERCIAMTEARERDVHAFVALDLQAARAQADAAKERYRASQPRSPIDGMPLGIKDIVETADFPTEMNSPIYAGWRSGRDAACVAALKAAGAIVLGKTVTTEFAVGAAGPTRNPRDLTRSPGGSSSGSAAAVAAGMTPAAIGSQTQSSAVRPASYCGITAFKPTYGALPTAGVHPLAPSLDHLSVLAITLDDAWCVALEIARRAGGAPGHNAIAGASGAVVERRPARVARLRTAGYAGLDGATRDVFEGTCERLRRAGIKVLEAKDSPAVLAIESALAQADTTSETIMKFEMRWPFGEYLRRHPDRLSARVTSLTSAGMAMPVVEYERALLERAALRARVAQARREVDAFITLAASGVAPVGLDSNTSAPRTFAVPWTLVGGPAVSLPILQVQGLPLGLQVMGYPSEDESLIRMAKAVGRALLTA
jgi:Asp-tRNA(Asn)/Glu-tRNA(Gln) amidotransferase A subunit family amidase